MNDPMKTDRFSHGDAMPLSADGVKRRDEMLDVLLAEQRERLVRRRRYRGAVSSACVMLLVAFVVYFWPMPDELNRELAKSPSEIKVAEPIRPIISEASKVAEYLESNSTTVTERLVCSNVEEPERVSLQHIDDDELLGLLKESGKPGILGIVGGEKRVVFERTVQF